MIRIKNLYKRYSDKVVYNDFNLDIEEGKITVLLGESGSGKTTLLNAIAGLTEFKGEIEGQIQPVSMVFQSNRLVDNLTIKQNLDLVCPNFDTLTALEEVGLKDYADHFPKDLSAGMKRRLAVQRALIYPSKTILMDEPLINLDLALKFSLIDLIKRKQIKEQRTVLFVTHDIKEAVSVGNRIIVLKDGAIVYDNSDINEKVEKELFDLMVSFGYKNEKLKIDD